MKKKSGIDDLNPVKDPDRMGTQKIALLIIGGFCLSGCSPVGAGIAVAETAHYAAQGEFLTDKWLSQWYGKPCSLANFIHYDVLCSDPPPDSITPPVYCYRTLGKPQCFETPDPFNPDRRLIGGLPQQRRQAERYRQYLATGTRWPLKPLRASPVAPPALPVSEPAIPPGTAPPPTEPEQTESGQTEPQQTDAQTPEPPNASPTEPVQQSGDPAPTQDVPKSPGADGQNSPNTQQESETKPPSENNPPQAQSKALEPGPAQDPPIPLNPSADESPASPQAPDSKALET